MLDKYLHGLSCHSFEWLGHVGDRSVEEIKRAFSVKADYSKIVRNMYALALYVVQALDGDRVGGEQDGIDIVLHEAVHRFLAALVNGAHVNLLYDDRVFRSVVSQSLGVTIDAVFHVREIRSIADEPYFLVALPYEMLGRLIGRFPVVETYIVCLYAGNIPVQ